MYNLTVVHFNPQKREFSLLLNIHCSPYSMLGCNRTITRANMNVLLNTGPGAGGGRKKRSKKSDLPNNFDDDCRLNTGLIWEWILPTNIHDHFLQATTKSCYFGCSLFFQEVGVCLPSEGTKNWLALFLFFLFFKGPWCSLQTTSQSSSRSHQLCGEATK